MEVINDHNVYILGAGFSRQAGMPLVFDFLLRMRDSVEWLRAKGRNKEIEAISNVLNFRKAAASAAYWVQMDLENIEELFSLASANLGGLSGDIQTAIAATLDFSKTTSPSIRRRFFLKDAPWCEQTEWLTKLEEAAQFELPLYTYYVAKLLGMFKDGKPKGKSTFVSFNYDTVMEEAFGALGVSFGYAFGKQSANYDESSLALPSGYDCSLLKLHGSVNWGRRRSGRGRAFTVYGNYSDVLKAGAAPELVPPTWKKSFEDQLTYVWDEAIRSLCGATRIVVIGFSMPQTDMHFKYLLAAALKDSVSLREIIFIDPKSDVVKRRAGDLLRQQYIADDRISFFSSTLEQMTDNSGLLDRIGRSQSNSLSSFGNFTA